MTQQHKILDLVLVKLITATPGISDHFYSNVKQALYIQIDPERIYKMAVAIRLQPIVLLAGYQDIQHIIIMDLIPVSVIRQAEELFISLN